MERFSYAAFVAAAQRDDGSLESLSRELERDMETKLRAAARPEQEVHEIIQALRRVGHEIYSFDASFDWESFCTWGPTAAHFEWELTVAVTYEPPTVAVTFRRRAS
ncbi:MAG TPA: hypothetical protein VGH28_10890 [Polyangiaceae bacterium]|jgi:hypothetical protein